MTGKTVTILWPTSAKAEPGVVNRLGRVLHWFFTICAALWGLGVAGSLLDFERLFDQGDWGAVIVCGGFAIVRFAMGRAARYILSGE